MAKQNIDVVLLDESVVMYGFRCLMAGAELEDFKKNPVMLFMHNRAPQGTSYGGDRNEYNLPVGRWFDIRVKGSQLLAKPEFDDDDPFAVRIQSKFKSGYLNAASIWLQPLAASDEPELKLPGQSGPTMTRWGALEGSIVDIPNCRGAVAIRDGSGKELALSAAGSSEGLSYLTQLAGNVARPRAAAAPAASESEIRQLLDTAILEGRIHEPDGPKYAKLAALDLSTVRQALDRLPVSPELASLLTMSGRELYMSGGLMRLKELSEPAFRSKYLDYYGKEYTA